MRKSFWLCQFSWLYNNLLVSIGICSRCPPPLDTKIYRYFFFFFLVIFWKSSNYWIFNTIFSIYLIKYETQVPTTKNKTWGKQCSNNERWGEHKGLWSSRWFLSIWIQYDVWWIGVVFFAFSEFFSPFWIFSVCGWFNPLMWNLWIWRSDFVWCFSHY